MLSLLQASLCGLYHRNGMGDMVREELEQDTNQFTNLPHTQRYKKLLGKRKELPAFARIDEFYKVYSKNQIMIIVGETGCGKTTQIPQFVVHYDLPHIKGKAVACTQPRRVATMSVAKRVAEEMDVRLGRQVGYSIRFENMTERGTTFLKYMTDGMLLREAMRDPDLTDYSTIILDEVHERTLYTDVLMGLLKSLAKKRPDLKIIIMSATLDALKFQKYFGISSWKMAPLLKIPGRTHPVDKLYTKGAETNYVENAIRTVISIHLNEPRGDILLFLTGEEEIEESCKKINMKADRHASSDPDVGPLVCLPLYSCLSPQQQQRVFDTVPPATPDGPPGRKVVVSTNIAETSLTIDGIVYVVDPGFSKQKMYHPSIRIESLLVKPISKASAEQRAGRAGRTSPGKCYRLYTKQYFNEVLEEQNRPEILRCNLSSIVLVMKKLGIKDVAKFDYVDAPNPESLMRAHELLHYLEAIDRKGDLTSLGKVMAEFPLEPQLSKVLISSPQFMCSNEILTITAMLSVQNIWVRPPDQKPEADVAKARLTIPDGDHLTLLNVYNEYQQNLDDRKWASYNFISRRSLVEAENIRNHLQRLMERFNVKFVSCPDERKLQRSIRKALVCGFFMQVARKEREEGPYLTMKEDQVVALHRSCGLDPQPDWVIFDELVLTSRNYIRTVSKVKPEWLLEIAPNYFDISSFPEGETKRALRHVAKPESNGNTDATGLWKNIFKTFYPL